MTSDLDLTEYKAVSFDCYGTLIDWETGIAAVLGPWARRQGLELSDEDLLIAYADSEVAVEREYSVGALPRRPRYGLPPSWREARHAGNRRVGAAARRVGSAVASVP